MRERGEEENHPGVDTGRREMGSYVGVKNLNLIA